MGAAEPSSVFGLPGMTGIEQFYRTVGGSFYIDRLEGLLQEARTE